MASLTDSLVAWWDMEEASGDRVDSHGSYDLTATGSPGNEAGKLGNCADLNSTGKYLSSTDNALWTGGDLGLSCWVKLDSGILDTEIFWVAGRYTSAGNLRSFGIQILAVDTNDIHYKGFFSLNGTAVTSLQVVVRRGYVPLSTSWNHIVLTRNSTTATLYYNGSAAATAALSGTLYDNKASVPFRINGQGDGLTSRACAVDQCAFWTRELLPIDVAELYLAGTGISYADIPSRGGTGLPKLIGNNSLLG
jgi:hypothetical protein